MQISVLEVVKVDLNVAKETIDEKEAELEAVSSEVAVLKETINGLKATMAKSVVFLLNSGGSVSYCLCFETAVLNDIIISVIEVFSLGIQFVIDNVVGKEKASFQ